MYNLTLINVLLNGFKLIKKGCNMRKGVHWLLVCLMVSFLSVPIFSEGDTSNSVTDAKIVYCTSWGYYAKAVSLAEEIKDQSDSCIPLSKQIVQMGEDFDLDGIQKLADALEACWVNWFLDFLTQCENSWMMGFGYVPVKNACIPININWLCAI